MTIEPTEIQYMWCPDPRGWGTSITEAEEEALLAAAQEYLDGHEAEVMYADECGAYDDATETVIPALETPRVRVGLARGGRAPGVYCQSPSGDWQILGYSVPIPAELNELLGRAYMHACEHGLGGTVGARRGHPRRAPDPLGPELRGRSLLPIRSARGSGD